MRTITLLFVLIATACGGDDKSTSDLAASTDLHAPSADLAASVDLAGVDLAVSSDFATPSDFTTPPDLTSPPDLACPFQFFGGTDPAMQGWTVYSQQPATITEGAEYTQLTTSTNGGASSGGQLLIAKSIVTPDQPFAVDFVVKVVSVNNHNQLDAAVAIMGSLTGQFGNQTERSEMVFVDGAKLGWADDTQNATANALDDAFHTYRLTVDSAHTATLLRDGTPLLVRMNYTTNGTVAFGDQTNDANYDATSQLKSIQVVCP